MNGLLARLPPGAAAAFLVVGAVLLLLFILFVREILAVLFLGVVAGVALSPIADRAANWRVPRAVSVLLVYGLIAGVLVLFLWYAVSEIANEVQQLAENSDDFEERYAEVAEQYNLPPLEQLGEYVQSALSTVAPDIARQTFVLVTGILYVFTILVVALFFNTVKHSAREMFLSLVAADQRERTAEVLDKIGYRLRHFVLGELVSMAIIGVLTYVGLMLLGAPFPLMLAILAFFLELLPILGPLISVIPAALLALTESPELAIAVLVLYLVIQQIESNIVLPLVHRQELGMPAILVLSSALIGASAMGILGLLIALPLAAILHTLAVEVFIPWRQRVVEQDARDAEEDEGSEATDAVGIAER